MLFFSNSESMIIYLHTNYGGVLEQKVKKHINLKMSEEQVTDEEGVTLV
jgi:hypothetical protein